MRKSSIVSIYLFAFLTVFFESAFSPAFRARPLFVVLVATAFSNVTPGEMNQLLFVSESEQNELASRYLLFRFSGNSGTQKSSKRAVGDESYCSRHTLGQSRTKSEKSSKPPSLSGGTYGKTVDFRRNRNLELA